jgi:hypothetical protein
MSRSAGCGPAVAEIPGVPETYPDANNPDDMLVMARDALRAWRGSREGSAAERKAVRCLAFAFGRLNALGVLDEAGRG